MHSLIPSLNNLGVPDHNLQGIYNCMDCFATPTWGVPDHNFQGIYNLFNYVEPKFICVPGCNLQGKYNEVVIHGKNKQ